MQTWEVNTTCFRFRAMARWMGLALAGILAFHTPSLAYAQPPSPLEKPVSAVQFEGASIGSEQERQQWVVSLIGAQPDNETLQKVFESIKEWYRARGYSLATVVDYSQKPDGTLVIEIAEGRIVSLEVSGNQRTRSMLIERELKGQIGAVYRDQEIDAVRRRLGRLPYFKSVKVSPVPGETVGTARLQTQVEEEQSMLLSLAIGYSGQDGFVGYADLTESNLFGMGHQARLQWQRDQFRDPATNDSRTLKPSYALSYTAPRILLDVIDIGIEVYDRAPFYPVFYSVLDNNLRRYERRRGGLVFLSYHWGESADFRVQFRQDEVDFNQAPNTLVSPGDKSANRGRVNALGFKATWDTRERISNPRTGAYASLLIESTTSSSQFKFTRYLSDARYYLPLPAERSLAFRAVSGGTSGNVPLSEQFWVGGYEMLRGYELDEFNGDRMAVIGAEYRFPILKDIQGAIFVDHGLAWNRGQSVSLGDFKTGAGAGLRFASPIGAIRLDLAFGRKFFTYLSLGQAF